MNLTTFFRVGIVAANTLHVQYFDGENLCDKYDDFYVLLARVKDVAVLSVAEHVQQL